MGFGGLPAGQAGLPVWLAAFIGLGAMLNAVLFLQLTFAITGFSIRCMVWLCVFLSCNKLLHVEIFAMLFGMPEIILRLLIQPAFCRGIKSDRKPDSHFGTDIGLAVQHG